MGAIKNDNPEKRATPDTQDLLKVFTKKTKPNHVTKKLICFCLFGFLRRVSGIKQLSWR
jgi:hypothetical protein